LLCIVFLFVFIRICFLLYFKSGNLPCFMVVTLAVCEKAQIWLKSVEMLLLP
jgi:hypothetical protein